MIIENKGKIKLNYIIKFYKIRMSNKDGQTNNMKYNQMKKLENKLNGELGDLWWNKYISSAFWSNISTPINLAITILSAITAGQATTEKMISPELFFKVSMASLLLSTLNTFFRPHSQLMSNMTAIKSINEFGARFETIYYSDCASEEDYKKRFISYTSLSQDFNKYQIEQTPEEQNFFTDFIYIIIKKYSSLKNTYRWLDVDMIYQGEKQLEKNEDCCKTSCCSGSTCCIPSKEQLEKSVIESEKNKSTNVSNLMTIDLSIKTDDKTILIDDGADDIEKGIKK